MRHKDWNYVIYIFCLVTFWIKHDPSVFLFGIMHLLFDVVLVLKSQKDAEKVSRALADSFEAFRKKVYGAEV